MISLLSPVRLQVSVKVDDGVWDAFLLGVSSGHYSQSSSWAQVKALLGWKTIRIVVQEGQCIVAGVQLLIRSLPCIGSIGYAPGGPLFLQSDPSIASLLLTRLDQVVKEYRLQYLLLQPRQMWPFFEGSLLERGFQPTERSALAVSTLLLDLTQDTDHLLKSMRKSTRRNIRLSRKAGVTVREGTARDLPVAYNLMSCFSQRIHAPTFSEEYVTNLWNILHPFGYLHLFIAEYAGEAVAASLVISFGETVTDTIGAWNGLHAKAHPNELLEWTAILWAKSQGYRFFDFDGFALEVARGEELLQADKHGASFFKLGFGGYPVFYPVAYEYLANGFVRWLFITLEKSRVLRLIIKRVEHFVRFGH